MMAHRRVNRWIPAVGALLVPLWTPAALAADLTVTPEGDVTLNGKHVYDRVEIGTAGGVEPAVLSVLKYDAGSADHADLGWLRLRARTIIIHPNGRIDATGMGFSGTTTAGGGAGAGHTPSVDFLPAPGGGGAHIGYGGAGTTVGSDSCLLFAGAEGGSAYQFDQTDLTTMQMTGFGSSGGTAHSLVNLGISQPGGAGGGLIILEAIDITLQGQILADGAPAPTYNNVGQQGVAAGGGAGGVVIISAAGIFDFDRTAASPLISAAGGVGATDAAVPTVVGGGGGGGMVVARVGLEAPDAATLESLLNVAGGVRADFPSCTSEHPGGTGLRLVEGTPVCPDIDEDTYDAEECGGDDCDDSDPEIHPGVDETCNGIDDNCVAGIDEEPAGGVATVDARCSEGSGQLCVEGACVDREAVAPVPTYDNPETRLFGGLCSVPLGMRERWAWAPVAGLMVVGGLGLAARRRRRARSQEQR